MPAPSRYLVPLPGHESDVLDSAHLGSWFQPEDQTADAAVDFGTTPDTGVPADQEGAILGGETTVEDPPAPDEPPGEITEFARDLTDATGGWSPVDEAGLWTMMHSTWSSKSGNPSGTDDDPFYLSHTLEGTRAAIGTTVAASPQDLTWRAAWMPDPPASAIGVEVEQVELAPGFWAPVADPLSAVFTITLAPSTYLGTISGLVASAVLNTEWGAGDLAWGYAPATDPPLLDFTVHQRAPVTLVSADNGELGSVYTVVPSEGTLDPPFVDTITVDDFSYAPPHTGLVGFHSQVGKYPFESAAPTPVLDDGVAIEVRPGADITGVYTIRPPRIRWIYAVAPYRRLTQRGDGLAGGARRIHPRPKSIQGSNRRGGGFL